MELALQTLLNGVLIGGILICLTIGFQLTFGVLHVIDFAVGGWVMLGGYAAYWASTLLGVEPFISIFFVFALFALIGRAMGPLIYHVRASRYARPDLMALAFTFGIFIMMRGGALWLWSYNSRNVETVLSGQFLALGPVTVPLLRLSAFVLALLLSAALFLILYRSRFDMAVRAVAQDRDNAGLMGVDVKRVSAWVYGIYTGMTASAGVLVAIARALVPNPDFVLLEEPSAGLSPAVVHETIERVQALRERGVGVVMVEQNIRGPCPSLTPSTSLPAASASSPVPETTSATTGSSCRSTWAAEIEGLADAR